MATICSTSTAGVSLDATTYCRVIETDIVAVQEDDDGVPSRVNDYAVLAMLGEGSFSKVYHCRNSHNDEYALKILKKSFLKRKREYKKVDGKMVFCNALEKVQREVAIMKKLAHTNLVKLHEIIDNAADDKMFLVLELVQGGQVMDWDDKAFRYQARNAPTGVLETERARSCMRDVVLALSYLHANHICHRDIKPENILLTTSGVYKLADFGVAHMLDDDNKTRLRSTEGTYHFLAPECTTGDAFDPFQVDIWALGVTLAVLLQGTLPFGTQAASLTQVMDSIRDDALELSPTIDPDCVTLLQLLLEKDPNKRIDIQTLQLHPWILHATSSSSSNDQQVAAAANAAIVHVSQQEIDAAFTPVNNFILMTKLKMKMSSRLARARKSVEKRHDDDVDGLTAVAIDAYRCATPVAPTPIAVPIDSDVDVQTTALGDTNSASSFVSTVSPSGRGDLIRRRSGSLKSNVDELDSLVLASMPPATSDTACSSSSTGAVPLPHVRSHQQQHAASASSVVAATAIDANLDDLLTSIGAAVVSSAPQSPRSLSRPGSRRRMSPSGQTDAATAHESPRLPPLSLTLPPSTASASSPTQSPTASPHRHGRLSPERCRSSSQLDHVATAVAVLAASVSALDTSIAEESVTTPSVPIDPPRSHSPSARRVSLLRPNSTNSMKRPSSANRLVREASNSDNVAMLPRAESAVALQCRKSGLLALASSSSPSASSNNSSGNDLSAAALGAVPIDDRTASRTTSGRPRLELESQLSISCSTSMALSRSSRRTKSFGLSTLGTTTLTTPERSPVTPTTRESASPPRIEVTALSTSVEKAPKMFEKRKSSIVAFDGCDARTSSRVLYSSSALSPNVERTASKLHGLEDTVLLTAAAVAAATPSLLPDVMMPNHHYYSDSQSSLESLNVDGSSSESADSPNAPRRCGLVQVFSKRRSVLEAQGSLQVILRRKSSALKLALTSSSSCSSEANDAPTCPDDVDPVTDANTAANAGTSVTVLTKRPSVVPSVLAVPALLHRASSTQVVVEAPKATALFKTQQSVVCSVM